MTMNGESGVEFGRFGSSIPMNYWGCCAADIIQNFKVDPDAKCGKQLVNGDVGVPVTNNDGEPLYAGPTYRDAFHQLLRVATFSKEAMPNHAFFVILERHQMQSHPGDKWLPILKAAGFEFLRKVNNSVWNRDNFIFFLNRNVGPNACADMFTPPAEWTALPSVVPEPWQFLTVSGPELTTQISKAQKPLYAALPVDKFMTEAEVRAAGAPVFVGGLRSDYHRPQLKEEREAQDAAKGTAPTLSLKADIPLSA